MDNAAYSSESPSGDGFYLGAAYFSDGIHTHRESPGIEYRHGELLSGIFLFSLLRRVLLLFPDEGPPPVILRIFFFHLEIPRGLPEVLLTVFFE